MNRPAPRPSKPATPTGCTPRGPVIATTTKPRTVPGALRIWLLGNAGPLDEPKGFFRTKDEVTRYARGRKHWAVWEPTFDEIRWTYKEPRTP